MTVEPTRGELAAARALLDRHEPALTIALLEHHGLAVVTARLAEAVRWVAAGGRLEGEDAALATAFLARTPITVVAP